MNIVVMTTGGTLDKVYFDARSAYEVGHSVVPGMLAQARMTASVELVELMRKDSLDITDEDRRIIAEAVRATSSNRIIITHGTDTMVRTAGVLRSVADKTIVMTGALSPARFAESDAGFNLGLAFGAVQSLPPGVYVAMNGRVFDATRVRKNLEMNRFEEVDDDIPASA